MMKKIEFDINALTEIMYINIDVPVDSTECKDKIMNYITRSLPADSNRYYIEHEKGSNTFKVKEYLQQKDKDRLFELIVCTEEN